MQHVFAWRIHVLVSWYGLNNAVTGGFLVSTVAYVNVTYTKMKKQKVETTICTTKKSFYSTILPGYFLLQVNGSHFPWSPLWTEPFP